MASLSTKQGNKSQTILQESTVCQTSALPETCCQFSVEYRGGGDKPRHPLPGIHLGMSQHTAGPNKNVVVLLASLQIQGFKKGHPPRQNPFGCPSVGFQFVFVLLFLRAPSTAKDNFWLEDQICSSPAPIASALRGRRPSSRRPGHQAMGGIRPVTGGRNWVAEDFCQKHPPNFDWWLSGSEEKITQNACE